MCGIAGLWNMSDQGSSACVARDMALQLSARGPDSSGEWAEGGVALAHRRLSIVDLSPAGHQPMLSRSERFVISYNGEIYNHPSLRSEIESTLGPVKWRGHSDTETLLAALDLWGIPGTMRKLNGMFAFALWDRQTCELTLARDRLGEKPLYYGRAGTTFLFGSELKALAAHPDWSGQIDRQSLTLFMRHNYVPAPHCIYQGIFKLPPAHVVTISQGGTKVGDPECYWDLEDVVARGQHSPRKEADGVLTDELEVLLRDAVGLRMAADVPLGAFLSGGIDSSTIVALMQAQSSRPVRTFSIGFDTPGFNEAVYAKAVANHLGTDHTELYVQPRDALAVIPDLPRMWDEPFADVSQIPTFLVSKLARRDVTVALSGDGGDELFCGYRRYQLGSTLNKALRPMPRPMQDALSWLLSNLPTSQVNTGLNQLRAGRRVDMFGDKLAKLAEIIRQGEGEKLYRSMVSSISRPETIVVGGTEPETLLSHKTMWPKVSDFREQMMYLDMKTYLPDDILTKVDRASMAVSLEARVPLLDHRVVEFAWQLPLSSKVKGGESKWILRQVLDRYVPRKLIDRPKMGFGVPIETWLTGPLRGWADALLDTRRLVGEGYLNAPVIRAMWQETLAGKRRWHAQIWTILMFQAWLEKNHRNINRKNNLGLESLNACQ